LGPQSVIDSPCLASRQSAIRQSAICSRQSTIKKPAAHSSSGLRNTPGSDLLSHAVTHAVPSAVAGLTSVFGMGTGVSLLLLPPGKFDWRFPIADYRWASPIGILHSPVGNWLPGIRRQSHPISARRRRSPQTMSKSCELSAMSCQLFPTEYPANGSFSFHEPGLKTRPPLPCVCRAGLETRPTPAGFATRR
jgi:hypothetical protein